MTEETTSHAAPTRDEELPLPTAPEGTSAPAAKKAPLRRKVAARQKAAPVVEAAEATDGAMVKPTVKARRPRAPRVAKTVATGEAADAPARESAQPELPGPATPAPFPEPEARVERIETQAAPAPVDREPPASAPQASGRDGSADAASSPAMPPPGDLSVVPTAGMHSPAQAVPGGVLAEPPPAPPAQPPEQSRPFEPQGQGRGDYRPGPDRRDRPQQSQDGRPPQQQGGGRRESRFDRQHRQQGGGQHPNDRQGGQYGERAPQGGGQYNDRPQQGGQYNDRPQQGQSGHDRQQGGGQFNRHNRNDRNDRGERDGQPGFGAPAYEGGGQPGQGADGVVSRPTEVQYGEGIVEVSGKGFGFLREAKRNFVQTPADTFVTPEVCRKYNLRDGQWIKGEVRRSSRGPQLFRLTHLNGEDVENYQSLPNFDELTTINPKKRIKLETTADRYTTRVMDLMTPVGKGQRGLIVAPPRTGKTTLLQHIAEAVVQNHPEMKLIILLVDERPEEVTEIRRGVPQAEIMASSNDSDLKSHVRIAQLAMERCKRLVEAGQHVFMLLDSITRMARAFNNATGNNRGTQSGGLAVGALEIPRKIFAAARNTEEAGSLTIMATALIETNSKMDDAIFQEFKGTGNMELVLDRKISDQRVYPAVDIFLSGTRREELLLQSWELDKINVIRRGLAGHKPLEAIERLLSFLKKFPTNAQMLMSLPG